MQRVPCGIFRLTSKPLAVLLLGMFSTGAMAADELVGLGFLPGKTDSFAYRVSTDGSVVVGHSSDGITGQAFRWENGVMTGLGFLGTGTISYAYDVSADGSVVVGQSYNGNGADLEAYRWESGVMTGLGFLGAGTNSNASAVSADGSVVVGRSHNGSVNEAFRWEGGVMTGLGFLIGGSSSSANGVSADGNVIVGYSDNGANDEAYRWEGGVMTGLGFLAGGTYSYAFGVSADGNAVIGSGDSGGNIEAFRWENNVMDGLGFLGTGTTSHAFDVSADGGVIVGRSDNGSANEAFRWTQADGMMSVEDWLGDVGVTLPSGWTLLESAGGVSDDGTVVVGYGDGPGGNTQAWLARVGPFGSGIIADMDAFNRTLIEAGSLAVQAGTGLANLTLFGAHHRSILDDGLVRKAQGVCVWVTADAARYNNSDASAELAEVGACVDVGTARLGLGLGQAWARQDLSLGGDARYDGQYVLVEAANAFGGGVEAGVTGYYGRFDADLRRNYMNGGAVDSSTGRPDAHAYAARIRLDWKDALTPGSFSLSPYAAYAWLETRLDGYTETSGGFPTQFNATTWQTQDVRIGVAGRTNLGGGTYLRPALEAVRRFDDSTNGVGGQILGLTGFSLPGQSVKQTWVRATLDVDHRITDTVAFTVGANAASSGGDASWGMTAGLRASF